MKRSLVAVAVVLAAMEGCTVLLPFDEISPDDGGADVVLPPRPDVSVDDAGNTEDVVEVDTARDVDLDALGSCTGKTGTYCGNNQLDAYPFPDDLVTCDGGKVVAARACTTGTKCLHLMNPHPDECDPCAGKIDGFYCGREFPSWQKTGANNNGQLRIHCRAGGVDGVEICATCTIGAGGKATCP